MAPRCTHPTAADVPEEDVAGSSAPDSQPHHTSPEAAAWTPSTPRCSEEGALHPCPELPHLPALASWHIPTTTTPRSRCPDRKCRAGAARCFRATRGHPASARHCARRGASLRACLRQPTRSPILRDAPAAAGRSVCLSLRVSGKCFCSRLISSRSMTRWQVSARARAPAWVCAAPAPRAPQSQGGFPDPRKGHEGHGTPAAQGGPWDAVAAWHTLLLEIGRFQSNQPPFPSSR